MLFPCTDALVTIASVEMETLTKFYTQLLGKNPITYIANVYAEFQFPNLRLGIFKPKETHIDEFGNCHQNAMSLCLEVTNLEDAIAHFTFLGYPPLGEIITASHGREIYAYDPAGNRLILHESANA